MDAKLYQELAGRTLIDKPPFTMSDRQVMILWCSTGIAGESGEISEHIKKGIFHEHGLDREVIVKELGDLMWYVAGLCKTMGISLDEVMEKNIEKLLIRYPNGFNSDDSKKRVDVNDCPKGGKHSWLSAEGDPNSFCSKCYSPHPDNVEEQSENDSGS